MATQSNQAMVSEVSICNQALTWLGQKTISSLDEDNKYAEWMRHNYPFLRDAVLEAGVWTFATVRALGETANRDEWDQCFSHDTPLKWINVLRVYEVPPVAGQDGILDRYWRLEGGKILSSNATVYLWGLEQVTDTAKFSPMFVQTLAARLCADATIPFTQDKNLQKTNWAIYLAHLRDAKAHDGKQGSNENIKTDSMKRARASQGFRRGFRS